MEAIVAGSAVQCVVTIPSDEVVVAGASSERIVAAQTVDLQPFVVAFPSDNIHNSSEPLIRARGLGNTLPLGAEPTGEYPTLLQSHSNVKGEPLKPAPAEVEPIFLIIKQQQEY